MRKVLFWRENVRIKKKKKNNKKYKSRWPFDCLFLRPTEEESHNLEKIRVAKRDQSPELSTAVIACSRPSVRRAAGEGGKNEGGLWCKKPLSRNHIPGSQTTVSTADKFSLVFILYLRFRLTKAFTTLQKNFDWGRSINSNVKKLIKLSLWRISNFPLSIEDRRIEDTCRAAWLIFKI